MRSHRLELWAAALLAVNFSFAPARGAGPPAEKPTPTAQSPSVAAAENPTPEALRFFEQQVRPILSQNCLKCHGSGKQVEGGLNLTSRSAILSGGELGDVVDLKKPQQSLLVKAINYADSDLQMPPKGKLPPDKIAALTRWVEMKLPYPAGDEIVSAAPARKTTPQVNDENRHFWSFRPVVRPPVPRVRQQDWVRTPIDAFILAKLEQAGLKPSPPASREVLIRRAYYDLIGLPPSPAEVAAFVADKRSDAYERLVDRLLDSPHYGERWGRHWLDLVRYAETNSYERDAAKPMAYGYRDYVIRSFNADKPYDRFIEEQLAGDELPDGGDAGLEATGFYRLGIWDDEPSDPLQARFDELDDVVTTVGQAFLGLTVNCARCHDHKLDPIPQRDYYRMLAFFAGTTRYGVGKSVKSIDRNSLRPLPSAAKAAAAPLAKIAAYQEQIDDLKSTIKPLEDIVVADLDEADRLKFKHRKGRLELVKSRVPHLLTEVQYDHYVEALDDLDRLKKEAPPMPPMVLCITEAGPKPPETHILLRGSPKAAGDLVEPGFLSIIDPRDPTIPAPPKGAHSSGRRLVLARWIASSANPLTARVMANRVWQYHFGRGIVRSPNNFGLRGDAPTHPELLDYLAGELVAHGWRLKALHRMIMLSNAYRMSSAGNPEGLARDRDNDLFWRFDMRRLECEEIRDSILAVNGSLNLEMFGESVYPFIPHEVLENNYRPGDGWHLSAPEQRTRRTIYVHQKRSLPLPILETFDAAEMDGTCPVRFASTQPTQALSMINGDFLFEQAGVLAKFAEDHAGKKLSDRVAMILRRVTQREPSHAEIDRGVQLFENLRRSYHLAPHEALRRVALVAYNLDEFVYLD